jgi:UDP-glucose 4-epimerase
MTTQTAQVAQSAVAKPAILVTGGAGYIGSHVVLALLDRGFRPVIIDNLSTGVRDNVADAATFVEGDVGDTALLEKLVREHDCKATIHFAGSIVVPESVEKPLMYYDNNVAKTIGLLEVCQQNAVNAVIFSSTAAVYAGRSDRALSEQDTLEPANPYGRSKLMIEHVLRDLAAASDVHYGVLRYFNVAGADPDMRTGQSTPNATHLIKRACQTAVGKIDHIDVFGTDYDTPDGTGVRDYIHISDLADAHVAVLEHLLSGGDSCTYNCGYGHGYSVAEVLDSVDRVNGTPIERQLGPRRAGDAASLVADSTALRQALNWRPAHDDLDHIVDTALRWEKKLLAEGK